MPTIKSKPAPWSHEEDRTIVADYLAMRAAIQRGEKVNKAATRRALLPLLNNRSEASIEFKRMNISAVLEDLGRPYIQGYKPYPNYQTQLRSAVESQLGLTVT